MKNIKTYLTIITVSLMATACGRNVNQVFDDGANSATGSNRNSTETTTNTIQETRCFIDNIQTSSDIEDNFERADLITDGGLWSTLIDDRLGNGEDIEAKTFGEEMGEAASGDRALYIHGREGFSVHDIFLISTKLIDLSGFNRLTMSFDYFAIGLNDFSTGSLPEYFKVEYCNATAAECGLANPEQPEIAGLQDSSKWTPLFYADPADAILGPIRHTKQDWTPVKRSFPADIFPNETYIRIATRQIDGFVGALPVVSETPGANGSLADDLLGIDNFNITFEKEVKQEVPVNADGTCPF